MNFINKMKNLYKTRNLVEIERQHYQELFEYLPVGIYTLTSRE